MFIGHLIGRFGMALAVVGIWGMLHAESEKVCAQCQRKQPRSHRYCIYCGRSLEEVGPFAFSELQNNQSTGSSSTGYPSVASHQANSSDASEDFSGVPMGTFRGVIQVSCSPFAFLRWFVLAGTETDADDYYWVGEHIAKRRNGKATSNDRFEDNYGMLVAGCIETVADVILGGTDIVTLGWFGSVYYPKNSLKTPYVFNRPWGNRKRSSLRIMQR